MITIAGEVRLTVENKVARMTLSNPRRKNAISETMWEDILRHCDELKKMDDIRALVISGENGNFASGVDLSEKRSGPDAAKNAARTTQAGLDTIEALPFPVIAALEGYVIGTGCVLALYCDMRIAGEDARLSMPGAKRGIGIAQQVVDKVVRLIGPAFGMEMMFMGEYVPAAKALSWGLVNEVVPNQDLDDYIAKVLDVLTKNAPLSIRSTKENVRGIWDEKLREGGDPSKVCRKSDDIKEGVRAFLEKREPEFKGR